MNKKILIIIDYRTVESLTILENLKELFNCTYLNYENINESSEEINKYEYILVYIGDESYKTLYYLGIASGLNKKIYIIKSDDDNRSQNNIEKEFEDIFSITDLNNIHLLVNEFKKDGILLEIKERY